MAQKNQETLNRPAGILRGYEVALFLAAVLLCELRMFIGTYLYILKDQELLFHIEIRAGEFVALAFFAFLVLAFFKLPHFAQRFKSLLQKFRTYDYAFLAFLACWYLLLCLVRRWSLGYDLFLYNEWWIYITFITSFVFFPLAEFAGAVRAKKVIHPMIKAILLPNMVFMAWILWQWFHNVPLHFPSGSTLSELKTFVLAVGENRMQTAVRALTMLFLCLYLTASEKGWRKVLYGVGSLENLAVMILTNNRSSFYSTLAVGALLVFAAVWHRAGEKKKLFRFLLGLLGAAACVLCLLALRERLFLLAESALRHSRAAEALAQAAAARAGGTPPQRTTLSASMGIPLQQSTATLSAKSAASETEVYIHTLNDGMNGREPIYRGSLYAMFSNWQRFLFGVTHLKVAEVIHEFSGEKVIGASAHNFFLQMGLAFGVPVMFLSVAFIALLVIRSWRILFRKDELFSGARMVPAVILPLFLADMFETTLTAGNTLPCAVFYLFAGWTVAIDRCSPSEVRSGDGVCVAVFTTELAALAALLWRMYPLYVTLKGSGTRTLIILTVAAMFCAFWFIGRLLTVLLQRQRPHLRHTLPAAVAALLFALCLGLANGRINRMAEQRVELLEKERPAIEIIQDAVSCVYVDHLPEVYHRYFGGDRHTVLHSDDLRPRQNVALITNADQEYPNLIGRGFLYTEISDREAVYTNSAKAAERLEAAGYHLTGYFSRDLAVEPDRALNLNSGPYRATVDLLLVLSENGTMPAPDEAVAKLTVAMEREAEPVASRDVLFSEFGEDGTFSAVLDFTLSKTGEVDFLIETINAQDEFSLQVEAVHCKRNPAYDTHAIFNSEGRRIREFYFTLEGDSYTQSDGSQGKEYDYDGAGNTNVVRYLDADGALILNSSGYAEVRRVYNGARQSVREDFYGIDGERIARTDGVSAADYEYDSNGNRNLERYYDLADEPVQNTSGYAERHLIFNKQKKIVREEYFDVDRKPKNIVFGYAALQNEYDGQGNLLLTEFFDAKGEYIACGSSNFHAYLKTLAEKKDAGASIFISIKDEGTNALTVQLLADLKELGLETNLSGKYRYSYYAVIGPEAVQEELSADRPVSIGGTVDGMEYSITSAGANAGSFSSIVIDETEYSKNVRGMNIVVLENGTVTDSVAFDTYTRVMGMTK